MELRRNHLTNIKMEKNPKTSKLARVWSNTVRVAGWLKNAALAAVITLVLIIWLPLLFVLLLIPFNPIVFWVWAIINPKSAAVNFYGRDMHKVLCGEADTTTEIMTLPWIFYWKLNRGLRFLLPWRCKKAFIAKTKFHEGSFDQHIRYFHEHSGEVIENGWLNGAELCHLWELVGANLRSHLLPQMGCLSLEQFKLLLSCNEVGTATMYAAKHTLSSEMLKAMVKVCKDEAYGGSWITLFCNYIKLHGLSADVVNVVYQTTWTKDGRKYVEEALEIFRQRKIVQTSTSNEWKHFCSVDGKLVAEAQKLMTYEKYLVYHEVTGNRLYDTTVAYFLGKGDILAFAVLKYEVVEGRIYNDLLRSLIAGNPEIAKEYLRLQKPE